MNDISVFPKSSLLEKTKFLNNIFIRMKIFSFWQTKVFFYDVQNKMKVTRIFVIILIIFQFKS